ncbi:MAG TPA: PLP-dependent aminotransferase family protein [Nocardioides sp.]|nr:PLP-dependent aminotransferase family protein [Nocardioides sp.]
MSQSISAGRVAALVGDFDRSPAYAGLADALRELVGDGRIGYDTRLPSERDLTEALGVSRTTVTRAYAALRETAYAEARQGSGTFTRLPGGAIRSFDRALLPTDSGPDAISLTCAASSAPPGIHAAYADAVADLPAQLGGPGYYPAGLPELRAAIARRYDDRGLPTRPEQVIVTTGALAALAVVGQALAGPRDRIMVESPTYPNAVQALKSGGGRVLTVPLDRDGWDLDHLTDLVARRRPRLAYLMPDFQNPSGLVMSASLRRDYARLLQRHQSVAVVDEAHQPLSLAEHPSTTAPFAALAKDAVTVGSTSKTIWGGLRIGWIRSPVGLVDELTQARVGLDLGAPVLEQLVVARLLDDGYDAILASNRARLREQRDVLVAELREHLPEWRFRVPDGGMVLWCELPEARSTALVQEVDRLGLHLAPGPAFAPEGGLDRFLRVPYTVPPDRLREAVRRLATAWAAVSGDDRHGGRGRRTGASGSAGSGGSVDPVLVA